MMLRLSLQRGRAESGPLGEDQPICRAPCDRAFNPGDQLYFAGEDIVPSSRFSLAGRTGTVQIQVTAGKDRGRRTAGVAMTAVGALGVAGGGFLALFGAMMNAQSTPSPQGRSGPDAVGIASCFVAGIGASLLVGGIVSLATSKRTRYEIARVAPGGLQIAF